MRIKCGSTRFVLLVGVYAIKIARVRPLRFLARALIMCFSKKRRKHFIFKYGDTFFQAIKNDVFAGLKANKNEYSYYTESSDCRVMPILQQFMYCCVIIQVRGTDITCSELARETPFCKEFVAGDELYEIWEPDQFCRHPMGQLVLVDYGRSETISLLRKKNI